MATVLIATLVVSVPAAVSPTPARADPIGQATGQANRVREQVRLLQEQTSAALHAYDVALAGATGAVAAHIRGAERAQAGEIQAARARTDLDARVRALYIAGGPLGLYSSLTNARSAADLTWRIVAVGRVVEDGRRLADRAGQDAGRVAADAARSGRAAAGQLSTARAATSALNRLTGLLDRQQRLLEAAEATVALLRAAAALRAARAAAAGITDARIQAARPMPAPAAYLLLYRAAAATCPGLSWAVLAAIGQVETGHGRDTATSPAGAEGPMQFLPATFAAYAVDGDGDGRTDVMDPADAIFTAGHFLCAHGAAGGRLRQAIFAYNHADWYVRLVLALAARYR